MKIKNSLITAILAVGILLTCLGVYYGYVNKPAQTQTPVYKMECERNATTADVHIVTNNYDTISIDSAKSMFGDYIEDAFMIINDKFDRNYNKYVPIAIDIYEHSTKDSDTDMLNLIADTYNVYIDEFGGTKIDIDSVVNAAVVFWTFTYDDTPVSIENNILVVHPITTTIIVVEDINGNIYTTNILQ